MSRDSSLICLIMITSEREYRFNEVGLAFGIGIAIPPIPASQILLEFKIVSRGLWVATEIVAKRYMPTPKRAAEYHTMQMVRTWVGSRFSKESTVGDLGLVLGEVLVRIFLERRNPHFDMRDIRDTDEDVYNRLTAKAQHRRAPDMLDDHVDTGKEADKPLSLLRERPRPTMIVRYQVDWGANCSQFGISHVLGKTEHKRCKLSSARKINSGLPLFSASS